MLLFSHYSRYLLLNSGLIMKKYKGQKFERVRRMREKIRKKL